jgi:antitoxin component of MazEF toxin-antitoxin module
MGDIIIYYNMGETFRAKVRMVGTSLGVLLPKEILKKENVKLGEEIEISVLRPLSKEERRKIIAESFGMAKKMKGGKLLRFERDRIDRMERWLK